MKIEKGEVQEARGKSKSRRKVKNAAFELGALGGWRLFRLFQHDAGCWLLVSCC